MVAEQMHEMLCTVWESAQHVVMHSVLLRQAVRSWQFLPELSKLSGRQTGCMYCIKQEEVHRS